MMSMHSHNSKLTRAVSGAALVAVGALLVFAGLRKIWGVDFWWQYAAGRYVLENGPPKTDVFSYTMAGQPWIELRWLYCGGLAWLVDTFGYAAPIIAKIVLLVVSFALVTLAAPWRRATVMAGVVLCTAVMASSQRFFVRPELVTFLFFALYVWIIQRWRMNVRAGGKTWFLWTLPVMQIVWTNAHTLFILGPLLAGLALTATVFDLFIAGGGNDKLQRLRRRAVPAAGVALVLTAAACFVNPWGFDGARFPFQLFTQIRGTAFKEAIGEFASPFSLGFSYTAAKWYYALLALCALSMIANFRRLDPFWLILVLSQFYLSALAIRNVPLFALAAVPFVIDNSRRGWLREWMTARRIADFIQPIAAAAVVIVCAWYIWLMATDRFHVNQNDTNQFGLGLAEHRYPLRAIGFLKENNVNGRIIHTMSDGACLLAHGHPVFMDPRLEVYGEAQFAQYLKIVENHQAFRQGATEYEWRIAVVENTSRMINHLADDPAWKIVYFDEVAAVFLHDGSFDDVPRLTTEKDFKAMCDAIRQHLQSPKPRDEVGVFSRVVSPQPYIRLVDFLLAMKQGQAALTFLEDAERAKPELAGLDHRRAAARQAAGDHAGALAAWHDVLKEYPDDANAMYQIATIHSAEGARADAAEWLEKSLEEDPKSAVAWAMLGTIRAEQYRGAEAASHLSKAVELEPSNAQYRRNLARVYLAGEMYDRAEAELQELREMQPGDPIVYRDLAVAAAGRNDLHAALEYVQQGLRIMPGDARLIELRDMLEARMQQ